MKVTDTKLTDVKIVEMDVFGDHRGFFTESYSKAKFAEHGLDYDFVQDNHSLSAEAGVLLYMFQFPLRFAGILTYAFLIYSFSFTCQNYSINRLQ